MKCAKILSVNQFAWTFALVLSLLFAQFIGQQHRLRHTNWHSDVRLQITTQAPSDGSENKNHSCFMFDAVTMADTVSGCIDIFSGTAGKHLLAEAIFTTSWVAPVTRHFLSRAPPRFF